MLLVPTSIPAQVPYFRPQQRLTVEEALVAGTVNAASALGIKDAGRLETDCAADFLVLQSSDWRDLVYTLGTNPVQDVWIGGKKVT